jgi:hypothetical protein
MASFTSTFEDQLTDGIVWSRTLVFSNYPLHHHFQLPEFESGGHSMPIINYSQLYNEFVVDKPSSESNYAASLIDPNKIQTGDILQSSDYRGVGSYYAVWLHADVFQNPASLCSQRANKLARSEKRGSSRVTEEQSHEDLDQYQLDTLTWKKAKQILSTARGQDQLVPLLEEKCPALLEHLTTKTMKIRLRTAIRSMKFQGDPGSLRRGNGPDWDNIPGDGLFQDGQTPSASDFFVNLPKIAFPILKKPSELSSAMNSHPFMQLYLFKHLDEMGYNAPPAVSIAPLGYFNSGNKERYVDLALLPPPLDIQTTLGFVLNKIQNHFPEDGLDYEDNEEKDDEEEEEGAGEEEEEEDVDEEGDNNDGRNKKRKQSTAVKKDVNRDPADQRMKYELAVVDFEAEDAITWCTAKSFTDYIALDPAGEDPILATRRMFHKHSEEIRKKLFALRPGSSEAVNDEELNSLFDQLLWT